MELKVRSFASIHTYVKERVARASSNLTNSPDGTLYEALARLDGQGLIEPVESSDRRRPYRLTAAGAAVLRVHLERQRHVTDVGLGRLSTGAGLA